ncbi:MULTISPECIES: hypothetical protein [Nitrospirillum]|uniref:Uncharacterized protein n=2 Tax=Nitrospirillum TaxID=1543705 RepID=A0A248JW33_9PROT|nr:MULTISPECIES: hypothetical protein [Nitrospirillum]ASG22730.1 hypothetical protein Y958_17620 [Nitrospirillum amazonense CBAmc]MDG3443866.1 hypothetical protein [Nitrospirillum amazonense]MEA1652426.1 hypothetical protein [Nitrospirillum sp. BR 11164]MEC4595216.1 hypothetical protein [Nitrospirillum amazonense]TWB31715.1 hypothetical protein FBZ88_10185 [Nitrospirillum amazonense]
MNAYTPAEAFAVATVAAAPVNDEAQRARLFDQFNAYWVNAASEGVPYDTIGTMSVMASIYGILAKYGKTTTAEYLEILAESVRSGEFSVKQGA